MCKPWVKALPHPVPLMLVWVACLFLAGGCAGKPTADSGAQDAAALVNENDASPSDAVVAPESSSDGVIVASAGTVSSGATVVQASDDPGPVVAETVPPVEAVSAESGGALSAVDQSETGSNDEVNVTESHTAEVAADDQGTSAGEAVGPEGAASLAAAEPSPVEAGPLERPLVDPCRQYNPENDTWLDRSQVTVYRTVCGATAWFDGFFGDRRYDQVTGETYGRISAGGYWDQINGFDPRLRFRARFALPSLRDRGSLLIGRGDEQDVIEERNTSREDQQNPVAPSANQDEAVSTFVGFGWDQLASLSRGLRLSVGVKLRTPIEPIVKIKYRRNWQLTNRNLLSLRPLAYWRSQEGLGATVQLDVDHVINSAFLFRWANYGNVSQDREVEGVNWGSTFYLFQALSEKQALTYSVFGRGETNAPITFQNAGFEFRYRQRILRKWLFIEYYGGVNWPRFLPEQTRKSNFGSGLRLEAYFGPAPDDWMR
jgi:hypothetical protein